MSCEKPLLVLNKKSLPQEDSVSYYIKQSQKKELKFSELSISTKLFITNPYIS